MPSLSAAAIGGIGSAVGGIAKGAGSIIGAGQQAGALKNASQNEINLLTNLAPFYGSFENTGLNTNALLNNGVNSASNLSGYFTPGGALVGGITNEFGLTGNTATSLPSQLEQYTNPSSAFMQNLISPFTPGSTNMNTITNQIMPGSSYMQNLESQINPNSAFMNNALSQITPNSAYMKNLQSQINPNSAFMNQLTSPFMPGSQTMNQLTAQFNPTMQQLQNTPGYQFALQQGEQAVANSYTGAGQGAGIVGGQSTPSGAAEKGAINYAEGLASTTYQQQFQNYLSQNAQIYNLLSGGANTAYNLAAGAANTGFNTAANAASGTIAGANTAANTGYNLAAGSAGQTLQNQLAGASQAYNTGVGGANATYNMAQSAATTGLNSALAGGQYAYNTLMGPTQLGEQALANFSGVSQNAVNTMSGLQAAGGAALASGTIGAANALGQGISNAGNAALNYNLASNVLGGGGGGYITPNFATNSAANTINQANATDAAAQATNTEIGLGGAASAGSLYGGS